MKNAHLHIGPTTLFIRYEHEKPRIKRNHIPIVLNLAEARFDDKGKSRADSISFRPLGHRQ